MARSKLTKKVVDSLLPGGSDYVEWCGETTGFGCRVRPSGRKVFIVQYRVKGSGPVRKVTIASVGKLTVEEARKEAERILASAVLGVDTAKKNAEDRAAMTVEQLCDEYIERGCTKKRESTLATDKAALTNHVKPWFGSKRIRDVTDSDFKAFMRAVERGDTRKEVNGRIVVRGGAGVARRTARVLSGVFTYAVDEKYLEKNPRGTTKIAKDNENERYLSAEEIDRLGVAMHEAETIGLPWTMKDSAKAKHRPKDAETRREMIAPHAVAAIRLLLATGMRSGEVLGLKWEFYDADNGFIYLPTSKTGKKVVVLSDFAREILDKLKRSATKDHPYVIEGAEPNEPRSDLKRPWARIIAHADLGKVRLHDIRHTFASRAALDGIGLAVVGKLLGHKQTSTTARYTHFAESGLRAAANRIANPLSDKIATRKPNVVPLKAVS